MTDRERGPLDTIVESVPAEPGRVEWLARAVAAAIALPTIGVGFYLDDWWHIALLQRLPRMEAADALFRFAAGDVRDAPAPALWWATPDLKLSFFRPLSAWLEVADYSLFGQFALGYHLHSVLWFLLFVTVGSKVLRSALPGTLAPVALLAFALDEVNWFPVAWIANRNEIVAAVPALFGLWAHLRWREDGRWWGLPVAIAGFAVGLAGGEAAVGAFGYLVAYELVGSRKRQLWPMLPGLLVFVAWLALYRWTGHGAAGSGSYLDPVADPLSWAWAAPGRALALLGCLLGMVPADLWFTAEPVRPALLLGGVLNLLLWLDLWGRAAEDRDVDEERGVRWLGLGALLAIVPVLSTFPANRLLVLPSLGCAAVLATIVRHWWRIRWTERDPGHGRRIAGGVLGLMAFGVAPAVWMVQTVVLYRIAWTTESRSLEADIGPDDRAIVLVAPEPATALFLPVVRAVEDAPMPMSWSVLSMAPYAHRFTRPSPEVLEMDVDGRLLDSEFERLVRSPKQPFLPGDTARGPEFVATILASDDGRPTSVRFTFDRTLDDPSMALLAWDGTRLVRATPPPVGGTLEIPAASSF